MREDKGTGCGLKPNNLRFVSVIILNLADVSTCGTLKTTLLIFYQSLPQHNDKRMWHKVHGKHVWGLILQVNITLQARHHKSYQKLNDAWEFFVAILWSLDNFQCYYLYFHADVDQTRLLSHAEGGVGSRGSTFKIKPSSSTTPAILGVIPQEFLLVNAET